MLVKTGLKAGDAEIYGPDDRHRKSKNHDYPPPPPPPQSGYTCDHCFGTKNRRGGLNNATCNSCW